MNNPNNNTIEFNSMVAVLQRLNEITNNINIYRRTKQYDLMLDNLIDYYKEICGDLTPNEDSIWQEIEALRNKSSLGSFYKTPSSTIYHNSLQTLKSLDEIDIKLRRLAKIHGYLTKTARSKGSAVTYTQ